MAVRAKPSRANGAKGPPNGCAGSSGTEILSHPPRWGVMTIKRPRGGGEPPRVAPNVPDKPLPESGKPDELVSIMMENARRFAHRMVPLGFTGDLRTEAGSRIMRVVGIGNPLLDVSASVDQAFLDKYGLERNGACVCQPHHEPVFDFLKHHEGTIHVPGGSCLNTLRVVQWLLQTDNATTYLGTVGKDEYGGKLRREAQADGLAFPELLHPTLPTGTCAVLIAETDRSLVASLGASSVFDHNTLESNCEIRDAVVAGDVFYAEGFVWNASPSAIYKLALHAHHESKYFMMNLSAPFVPGLHRHHWHAIMPYIHFLFGNGDEAIAFADACGWVISEDEIAATSECIPPTLNLSDNDLLVAAVALRLAKLPPANEMRPRTVVITQGAHPIVVAHGGLGAWLRFYPTLEITDSEIVDTNGSGDAFVGGFLSRMSLGKGISDCVHYGQRAAREIMKTSGCTLPGQDNDLVKEMSMSTADLEKSHQFSPSSIRMLRQRAPSLSASAHVALTMSDTTVLRRRKTVSDMKSEEKKRPSSRGQGSERRGATHH